jgi:hypothetical protein
MAQDAHVNFVWNQDIASFTCQDTSGLSEPGENRMQGRKDDSAPGKDERNEVQYS